MPKSRRKVVVSRKFNGKRFTLYATADKKSTAKAVANAARNKWKPPYNARITKSNRKHSPYNVWIRVKSRK